MAKTRKETPSGVGKIKWLASQLYEKLDRDHKAITHEILTVYRRASYEACLKEDMLSFLSAGVTKAVAEALKEIGDRRGTGSGSSKTLDFGDVDPSWLPFLIPIGRVKLLVPHDDRSDKGKYVPVAELLTDLAAFDKARRLLHRKANQSKEVAKAVDKAYAEAVRRYREERPGLWEGVDNP